MDIVVTESSSDLASTPSSPPNVQHLSLDAVSPVLDSRPPSPSPPPSFPPSRSLQQWLDDDSIPAHPDDYVEVAIWLSSEEPTKIWYPKSRLSHMSSDTMPHHDVFQRAEALSVKERQDFWCGEGGEHMIRFNLSERHQCHLLFVMWHDFQQLDAADQEACRAVYVARTYECLSKAKNSTRVIRQLLAFAHFVCDGGDVYIEPSKFIQCHSDVISQRALFKKLVKRALERVKQSEEEYNISRAPPKKVRSAQRIVHNTGAEEKPLVPKVAMSMSLCEDLAKGLLVEHPLVSKIVGAEVKDGLPSYTVEIKGASPSVSATNTAYSYEALAMRKENVSLLAAYNKEWKKGVARVGSQIDIDKNESVPTVTWTNKQTSEVSASFFQVVGWEDYYRLLQPYSRASADDDEKKVAPFTPVRPAAPYSGYSFSSTPMSTASTSAEKEKLQQIQGLLTTAGSKKWGKKDLQDLFDRLCDVMSESAAAETDKESVSESDGMVDVEAEEEEETKESDGSGESEGEAENEEPQGDDDEEPRSTRAVKRKATTGEKRKRSRRGRP